jgi:hypothetical protein
MGFVANQSSHLAETTKQKSGPLPFESGMVDHVIV